MNSRITLLVSLMAAASSSLYGLVNLGEGQINLSVGSSVEYDSEIRSRALGESDTIFTFRPSLTYVRPSKNFSLSVGAGVLVQRYFDNDEFDDENFFFDLNISPNADVEKSRFSFSGDILLNTETTSNEQVGEIVTTQNYGASGELTYHPNRNYSLVGNAHWNKSDPDSNIYFDFTRVGAGLRALIPLKETISWYAGTSFSSIESSEITQSDSDSWIYSTGVSGLLLPKVEGSLGVGVQERKFDSGGNTSAPYFSVSLSWRVDDLTRLSLIANSELGTTINDLSTETKRVTLSMSREMNRSLSCSASVGYTNSEYSIADLFSRKNESTSASLRINYKITTWGSVSAFASYYDQSSDSTFFEYDRTRMGVQLTGNW